MKAVLIFVLFGITTCAYIDPLKDLRSLLRRNDLRPKHGWDVNYLLKKRNQPTPPAPEVQVHESTPDPCFGIFECPGFDPSSPGGSRETGFTFSMNMFREACNFSRAMVRCYTESSFYQSCPQLTDIMPRFLVIPRLCDTPAAEYLELLIPCLNKKTLQDEIAALFIRISNDQTLMNSGICNVVAEQTQGILAAVASECTALQLVAAEQLNDNYFPFATLESADISHC